MTPEELDALISDLFRDPLDDLDLRMEMLFPKLPEYNRKLIQVEEIAQVIDPISKSSLFGGWIAFVVGTEIDGVGLTKDEAIHNAILKWHQLLAHAQSSRILITPPPSSKTQKEQSRNKKRKQKKK